MLLEHTTPNDNFDSVRAADGGGAPGGVIGRGSFCPEEDEGGMLLVRLFACAVTCCSGEGSHVPHYARGPGSLHSSAHVTSKLYVFSCAHARTKIELVTKSRAKVI
jgi:hypothetical protein